MDNSFNFDLLFDPPIARPVYRDDIIKQAALLFEFNLETDFTKFSENNQELLKSIAIKKDNGKYILPDEILVEIIENGIGFESVESEVNKYEIESDFTSALCKAINNNNYSYEYYSDSELFYLNKIAHLFNLKLNKCEINLELQRRHYFSPFKRIIKEFAGREKEIEVISDYVDWLPKRGIYKQTISFIRDSINWHDKPPLLIYGIGGIGKSTLIAKFIIDHNMNAGTRRLPFVYIDFDLPGFSLKEPLNIALECFRQLSIQNPRHSNVYTKISKIITKMMMGGIDVGSNNSIRISTSSMRSSIYSTIEELLKRYGKGLIKSNSPFLIVFDSFEEMQYRATRSELDRFFRFVKEVSEMLPRMRTVFAGRSEIRDSLEDIHFETLELKEFDKDSAIALLLKHNIDDKEICHDIYSKFGGNPLLLRLAADLVIKDKNALSKYRNIHYTRHEFLVNRILHHIHNEDVRKIAVPGMLVRRINADVILNILAEPCNVIDIDKPKSHIFFEELKKEVSLISKSMSSEEFCFRQDLRIVCEKMIWNKYPREAALIYQKAIDYYEKYRMKGLEYEAEYYYHRLKRGYIPEEFDNSDYLRLREYLEPSVIEFPQKVQLYIKGLISANYADEYVKDTSIESWEQYYSKLLKEGLTSDLDYLIELSKELRGRRERLNDLNSNFPQLEALVYQRLGRFKLSNRVIDEILELLDNKNHIDSTSNELLLIKSQNLEYQQKFQEALEVNKLNYSIIDLLSNNQIRNKIIYLQNRLLYRCSEITDSLDELHKFSADHQEYELLDTNWNFIFKNQEPTSLMSLSEYKNCYKLITKKVDNLEELESLSYDILGYYLKDITLTGDFEIVCQDFINVIEAKGIVREVIERFSSK